MTAPTPGPTETNFFARAGMEDTKLGQTEKDDPRDVARGGYDALMRGDDHVDEHMAKVHGASSEPGSGG